MYMYFYTCYDGAQYYGICVPLHVLWCCDIVCSLLNVVSVLVVACVLYYLFIMLGLVTFHGRRVPCIYT